MRMNTLAYVIVTVAVINLALTCFSQSNSNFSTKIEIYSNKSRTTSNQTNASTICSLKMDKWSLQNILNLMFKSSTQAVEIEIAVNTTNKTGNFPDLKLFWTSEIGRTIISLIAQTTTPIPWYFDTLSDGIEKVNVKVSEEIIGCLPSGDSGTDLIFNFLLNQLSHVNVTHDYSLCRERNQEYTCCRDSGYRKITVCKYYSSFLLSYAFDYICAVTAITVTIGLPLILRYLRTFRKENKQYEISDSPMALSSIFHAAFIDEKGSVRSAQRRLVFSSTVTLILYLSGLDTTWAKVAAVWMIPFTAFDSFAISVVNEDNIDEHDMYKEFIHALTLPFNLKHWWRVFPCGHMDQQNYQQIEDNQQNHKLSIGRKIFQFLVELLFTLVYLICFIFIFFFNLFFLLGTWFKTFFFWCVASGYCSPGASVSYNTLITCLHLLIPIFSLTLIIRALVSFLSLSFSLIAGFYLNGELYGPIVVPTLLLVGYSWKHWRSFVESKYLQLKRKIFQVCEELGNDNLPLPEIESDTAEQNTENIDDCPFTVDVEKGWVSKNLYEDLRGTLLPYDESLFWLFVRLLVVANFFLFLAAMILLAQISGVSGALQIISTMAVGTFPFIFDAIWADPTSEQKKVADMKLKLALRQMIKFKGKTGNLIAVEIKSSQKGVVTMHVDT